jgi:hypothetical protein
MPSIVKNAAFGAGRVGRRADSTNFELFPPAHSSPLWALSARLFSQ